MTSITITTSDIKTLRDEAGQAGDSKMVAICDRAINGSKRAAAECKRVILAARAQHGE